jgi:tetratricopeptide (TPR) repeat protein
MRATVRNWLICLGLVVGSVMAFAGVFSCDFVNYDDPAYVTANPHVHNGVTEASVVWAFTSIHGGNWHPLTSISHMVDCQIFGPNPVWHHLVNLLFHIANTLLLFAVLTRMTEAPWRSAIVAGLFAWHPLHVESVAWVSERKDVLSTFFWLLSTWCYATYVESQNRARPRSQSDGQKSTEDEDDGWARSTEASLIRHNRPYRVILAPYYICSLFLFLLALMSKPMVVTLPFTLLLLDYWPLRRNAAMGWTKLVVEKAPFFVLALAGSVVTFLVQRAAKAVLPLAVEPISHRVANALVSYFTYLEKMVWPDNLGIFYPLVTSLPAQTVIGATLVLVVATALSVALRRSSPYLITGWLWFLGTLVPVIGLVQVGQQSMADRYAYVPLIGIFIALVWGLVDLSKRWRRATRNALATAAVIVLWVCIVLTQSQVHFWQNSAALFDHALTINTNNYAAHYYLGLALEDRGQDKQAILHFNAAQQLQPGWPPPVSHLGACLERQGDTQSAMDCYESALKVQPDYSPARIALASLLSREGKIDAAANQYEEGLRCDPNAPDLHYNFANLLISQGKLAEAVGHYRESLRIDPNSPDAHNNLGIVLLTQGTPADAIEQFQEALRLRPDFPQAEDQLGTALQKLGRLDEARQHFAVAVQLAPDLAHARLKLGLMLAQQGQFAIAATQLERVTTLEPTNEVAWFNLAAVQAAQGHWQEAARDFGKVTELKPNDADAHARRGAALAQAGQKDQSIGEYERAAELTNHRQPQILAALDQAYAAAGRFAEAITTAQEAQAAAADLNQPALAQAAAQRLEKYRAAKP